MRLSFFGATLLMACLISSGACLAQATGEISPAAREALASQEALAAANAALGRGDYSDALSQAENLAAKGNPKAATLAASIYEQGVMGTAAPALAVRWYRRGVAGGDGDAMLGLARMGLAGQGGSTPGEALAVLQRAVAIGRKDAYAPLADLFLSGAAGFKDRGRAASLYSRAAGFGDAEAAYAAAILYADGDPDPMDDPLKAIGFLKQAATAGRADASADYGLMLYQGRGVARDLASAARWFKIAAEAGDADGAFYWALVNAKGEGTAQNLELALQWARVAKGSSPEADSLLAQLERVMVRPSVNPPPKAN
jgi:TPR repeat protein